jgi:hypothetical protein
MHILTRGHGHKKKKNIRSSQSRAGQDQGDADTALLGLVPKGEIVDETGEETSLKDTEQEAHESDGPKGLHATETDGDGAPGEHEEGDPARRAVLLEEDVGGHLEEAVGDEEDHEGDGELVLGHVGLRQKVVAVAAVEDAGVADVAAVQGAEEVDPGGEREDAKILLPTQGADGALILWLKLKDSSDLLISYREVQQSFIIYLFRVSQLKVSNVLGLLHRDNVLP